MGSVVPFDNRATQAKRRADYYRSVRRFATWLDVEARWRASRRKMPRQLRVMMENARRNLERAREAI